MRKPIKKQPVKATSADEFYLDPPPGLSCSFADWADFVGGHTTKQERESLKSASPEFLAFLFGEWLEEQQEMGFR